MSDEEVESFDITDEDLNRAFNPGARSFRKGLSKNQQIYGMWADDSGDEGPSNRSGFGKSRKPKNYSAPVSFVAGGVQQAGKKKEKEEIKNTKDGEEGDDDVDDDGQGRKGQDSSDSSEEDEPRASFKNLSMSQIDGEIAGLRKKKAQFNPVLANKGVGKWEQHTKGIGAKLLLQMGYQPGRGLGKDLQGIQAPIEANLRKGRGAIGAYGPEKGQKIADLETEKKKKTKETEKTDKVSQWRKEDGLSKHQTVRYVYKSIEDVLEESKQPGKKKKREFNELSKVKVIDMTGPEQRVLSGYHAISSVQKPSEQWEIRKDKKFNNFELPELQHNLNLLVDMCEEAIIANDRNLQYAENRCVALEAEIETLNKLEKQEADVIEGLDKVMEIVQRLVSGSETNTLTLQEASLAFKELREKYYLEYCMYEVYSLADTVVRPLFNDYLSAWSPLQDPSQPVKMFQQWRIILEQDQAHTLSTSAQDPYHKLLWNTWMPCVRIAASAWQCRKYEPMIEFMETWSPLLPTWITENILQSLILPRLTQEVEVVTNKLTMSCSSAWQCRKYEPMIEFMETWSPLLPTWITENILQSLILPRLTQEVEVVTNTLTMSCSSARQCRKYEPMIEFMETWSTLLPTWITENILQSLILPRLTQEVEVVTNTLTMSCSSAWQCRKYEPMIEFMETWSPLLPTWITENILQSLILPRLTQEVEVVTNTLTMSCSSAWQCRKYEPMIEFMETWSPLLPTWITENILQSLILPRLTQEVEVVTNTLTMSCSSAWQCRKYEPMIEFMETWSPLLPTWITENILQSLILPRLTQEVEDWNPLTDTIPIHTWTQPWLPFLGKYLSTTIFPMIRHKLSAALVSWHPSDCSARLMLRPWVGAFSKGEMDAFLVNNIVPKLHLTLQEFVINPHQQHLDGWNWVMEWFELLPSHVMASLLDKSFFPKWLQVLTLWLNLNPNYDQVTNWYSGWKSVIPEPLLAEPVVKEHLRSALELMNRSVGGTPAAAPSQSETAQAQARYQGLAECIRTAQQIPEGFKELVQKRCEERGILWLPLVNRYREAKQIYKCGSLQVYIDRNVLFVCNSGQWEPTSLNALLDMAS